MDKKVAVVVGAAGSIGGEIAGQLERRDFRVWRIWHRRQAAGFDSLQVDDPGQIEEAAAHIFEKSGRLDVLICAAGKVAEAPALATDLASWRQTFADNLEPAFLWSKAAAKYMLPGRYGRIVHVSSIAARFGGRGEIAYAASKGALEAMVRVLALELGRRQITVNAVAPGVIESPMTESIRREYGEKLLENISARRFGTPAEVAALAVFLASDGAAYINGQVIAVDGGMGLG